MVKYFKDGLKEIIGDGVDLLFCNFEEAMIWTGCETVEETAEQLKKDCHKLLYDTRKRRGFSL